MKERIQSANQVPLSLLLEFEKVFHGETMRSPEEYLAGANRETVLSIASYFLAFKSYDSEYEDNRKLIEHLFSATNEVFGNFIYSKIRFIESQGVTVKILNTYSSLTLFEMFFANTFPGPPQTTVELEQNLFKAYLAINSGLTSKQKKAGTSTDALDGDLQLPMLAFCMHYPMADKENFDLKEIWVTQAIKAYYLFRFMASNEKMAPLLTALLQAFKKDSPKEFLNSLLLITSYAVRNDKETLSEIILSPGESVEDDILFVEKLFVNAGNEPVMPDFITLRAKPYYKTGYGRYRIIFNLLLVEKLFKGMYFILRDINKQLPGSLRVTELKSLFSEKLSEHVLLYETLALILPPSAKKFTGEELDQRHIDGAPDYYVRKGKEIIIFESKDFLIAANKKMSFDYEVYNEAFREKLYFYEKKNKTAFKAVLQLINVIKKLLDNEFEADNNYHYRDIIIFPVLIIHDRQYDTPGFNFLISSWFETELQELEKENYFIHRIRRLTVINIDTLIYHQAGLTKKISLFKMLQRYHDYYLANKNFTTYDGKFMVPFSLFLTNHFKEINAVELPPVFSLIKPAIS